MKLTAGTVEAATAHVRLLVERLALVNRQLQDAERQLDRLVHQLAEAAPADDPDAPATDDPESPTELPDAAILLSLPGVGTRVLATLLTEGSDAVRRRDYGALRCLCGVAPVTRRSGKSLVVIQRRAAHDRLRDAVFHWSRVAVQRDPVSHDKYVALRARGHARARALRSVADRLHHVPCTMRRDGACFDPHRVGTIAANGVCRPTAGGSPRPVSVVDDRDAPSRPGRKAHNCHPSRGADGFHPPGAERSGGRAQHVDTPPVPQLRGADRPTSGCASPGRVRTEKHDPAGINGVRIPVPGSPFVAAKGKLSPGSTPHPLRNGPMTGGSVLGRSLRRATAGSGQQRTGSKASRPKDRSGGLQGPCQMVGGPRGRSEAKEPRLRGLTRRPPRWLRSAGSVAPRATMPPPVMPTPGATPPTEIRPVPGPRPPLQPAPGLCSASRRKRRHNRCCALSARAITRPGCPSRRRASVRLTPDRCR